MAQNLWHKIQTFPFPIFCDFIKKTSFQFFAFCVISWQLDLLSTSKWRFKSQFCFLVKWLEMVKKRQLGRAVGGNYQRRWSLHLLSLGVFAFGVQSNFFQYSWWLFCLILRSCSYLYTKGTTCIYTIHSTKIKIDWNWHALIKWFLA